MKFGIVTAILRIPRLLRPPCSHESDRIRFRRSSSVPHSSLIAHMVVSSETPQGNHGTNKKLSDIHTATDKNFQERSISKRSRCPRGRSESGCGSTLLNGFSESRGCTVIIPVRWFRRSNSFANLIASLVSTKAPMG